MIQVENLTKYYHSLCAVDQISFNIEKGEILGLLGPNGAGKTTTLRMLTGYLKPSSGNIRVKGLSIEKHILEIKKILGYLPESAPLYSKTPIRPLGVVALAGIADLEDYSQGSGGCNRAVEPLMGGMPAGVPDR